MGARLGFLGCSFIVCICLPAILTLAYLLSVASAEFESEARFAVRSATESKPSAVSDALAMLSSAVGARSTAQDSFIVAEYIRSRTIIEDLGGKERVYQLYSGTHIDWLSRLPLHRSLEDVWLYWRKKVTVVIDTQANVLTLRVRAYKAQDAKRLAEGIVQRSELLVNEMSERVRRDALSRAQAEVDIASEKLAKIRAAMQEFRVHSKTIDPVSSAASLGETLTLLTREKITMEANRDALRGSIAENAPSMKILVGQIDSINAQISALQDKLTSRTTEANAVAGQLSRYEDLQLQSQFAEKILTIAQSAMEKARMDQERQQLYLVSVVRPTSPEEATFPTPLISSGVVFAVCLMLWSMMTLIIYSIRDHIE
jgi:capsular polysaccharide transport system permease protein